MGSYKPLRDRLLSRIVKNDGCWIWTGAVTTSGYGRIGLPRHGTDLVHRVSYKIFKGPIPQGLHIDHLCMNRLCCNPDHLEAVTQAENNRRENSHRWQGNNHCRRGHIFTNQNTGYRRGFRYCRICHCARKKAKLRGITIDQFLSQNADVIDHGQRMGGSIDKSDLRSLAVVLNHGLTLGREMKS